MFLFPILYPEFIEATSEMIWSIMRLNRKILTRPLCYIPPGVAIFLDIWLTILILILLLLSLSIIVTSSGFIYLVFYQTFYGIMQSDVIQRFREVNEACIDRLNIFDGNFFNVSNYKYCVCCGSITLEYCSSTTFKINFFSSVLTTDEQIHCWA